MSSAEQAGTPPDDPQELKQEIERTREQLGETVEALAAKADVKAQARAKAGHVTGRLKSRGAQARQQAAVAAQRLSKVTPDSVQRAAAKAAVADRGRRVQLVMAAGAVVLAWLAIARWRRR
jgi:CHASE3 domain sensor protein